MSKGPQIFAIASGKGGTGKSMIASSLGYILSHCGFKTLLIDADVATAGLTYYLLGDSSVEIEFAIEDRWLLTKEQPKELNSRPQSLAVRHEFCRDNLFFVPAVRSSQKRQPELSLGAQDAETYKESISGIIHELTAISEYDFILIDTRGGTDASSVGACLSSNGFVIVTEADKTSWDVGRVLLNTIKEERSQTKCLGFILNKNVLPSDAIEVFLRRHWECPHLTTIPLDKDAVRYYQEDKVPVGENLESAFSIALMPTCRKLFMNSKWSDDQKFELEGLEIQTEVAARGGKKLRLKKDRSMTASFLIKLYGTLIATGLLLYYAVILMRSKDSASSFLPIVVSILIFTMTASDQSFTNSLRKLLLKKGDHAEANGRTDREVTERTEGSSGRGESR